MNRTILTITLMMTVLLSAGSGALAQEAAAPAPDDALRLGTVRDDTLFVDRAQLVAVALERNEMLMAAGSMADAADAEATGALAGYLPRVSANSYFLRSDDALNSFGYRLQNRGITASDFAPDNLNNPGETNHWVTSFQLQQPIFNGGMGINGKQAADAAARAANFDHARARETVVLQSIEVFEGLTLALSLENVIASAIKQAEAHESLARSLMEAEMATEADVLQATVFLSRLRQQEIIVHNQVAMAGEMVRLLTAIETPFVIAPSPVVTNLTAPQVANTDFRSDILARGEEARAAAEMANVAVGAMLPHINFSIQRDYYSHDTLFGNDAKSWGLGVYGTWDLFKGMENIAKVRQTKAEKRAAEYRFQFESRKARHEAAQARRNAEASRSRVTVAEGAVDAARASLRIVSNQYREGLASMIDLLDVQTSATRAEGDLVQALHDQRVDLARLIHAAGSGTAPGGNQ